MGRPKLAVVLESVTIRLTRQEINLVKFASQVSGTNRSDFIRTAAVEKATAVLRSKTPAELEEVANLERARIAAEQQQEIEKVDTTFEIAIAITKE